MFYAPKIYFLTYRTSITLRDNQAIWV